MSKPRKYGMAASYNPKLWRGLKDRKSKPRPREKVTPKPVAGRPTQGKEGQA
jgi:hypothetical protein